MSAKAFGKGGMGSAPQVWGREGKRFRRNVFPSLPQWFYTILENEPAGDDADNDAVEQEGPEGLLDDHALAAGEAHNGADGHDVVDADHVAHAAADGLSGNDNYKTGRWLGFQGKDLDAVIDLKEPTEFSKVSFNTNVVKGDWIMGAAGVTVKVSDDGQNFKEVASKVIPSLGKDDKDGLYPQEISFDPVKARYVEVIIKSDKLPTWHGGAGNPAFLFVDEINLQ